MAQLSDDCFAFGGALTPLDDALALLEARVSVVADVESVPLRGALGRILADDIRAGRSVPPHDNSAVDGYAVRFAELDPDGETSLPVIGRIAAGDAPALADPCARGAVRIFTGAVMPAGFDTVMMQEDCREDGTAVHIAPGIKQGANRRFAGEDVEEGAVILKAGLRLRPQDLGLAASVGLAELPVRARLRAALFSTGNELREPGAAAPSGAVYDANRFALAALLEQLGCIVSDLGILPDDRAAITDALAEAGAGHDLVLTSGGVSVGEEDHVRAAVESLGQIHFWRLAIKPGRPVALGQIGRTPFVGLPGNPVAVMVTFLRFARPLIDRLAGANVHVPRLFPVRAGFDHRKKANRREWVRATLEPCAGGWTARKFVRQGAGILSSMTAASGLVELPEDATDIRAGTMVDFLPFSELGA
ncbi:MAG: molybdopterin molybdotransferase MoeA [Rhodospirillaceae bacterium]|nr:molybdopterin molybdotransferase MoeA [Rhodospirillaceae bacterium]MYF86253.1 molybdopterin molybdotransferase MoeA [Rhodospirillaceae bacterium]MYH39361.1 molybdopterin molybdotransferase MoeA [Rhodospirillaceae bacterium]MYK13285.1 molybdopterin molybdotransferase MoeA [Rhodospirillaceae bacterium]MYK60145.1 molybdopterin molybdotransferase MoeA [Rhodospirillaceae bacterium]